MTVDDELRAIAEKSAGQYPDSLLTAQGWTRTELIDAIHTRLRNKYTEMRDTGQLYRDNDGQIRHTQPPPQHRRGDRRRNPTPAATRCPHPTKLAFTSQQHAYNTLRYWNYEHAPYRPTRAYLCICGSYHLTSMPHHDQNGPTP